MTPAPSPRRGVFISYSHRDAPLLQRLKQFLAPLEREGIVDYWDDTRITPGMLWRDEINRALANARVAVLLVSADFIASKFVVENELPPLLQAAETDGAVILPVIVGPSSFTEIESLSRFQAVNSPDRPLRKLTPVRRDEVLKQVADAVVKALGTIRNKTPQADASPREVGAQSAFPRLRGSEADERGASGGDAQDAIAWLRESAEAGNVGAQAELGAWYLIGEMTQKNVPEGLKWLRKAAAQGHPNALYNLAQLYAKGEEVAKDNALMFKLITQAAELGHRDAQYYLAQMYRTGEEWLAQDVAKARAWYVKAAEQGQLDAQNNLGALCHLGLGGPKDDVEAVKWLRMAAEQGDASGEYNLGLMYRNGDGVPQDYQEALKWHYKAADRGYAQAQAQVGIHFSNGWGVPADQAQAALWFQKAAAQGEPQAEFNLGVMYGKGLGIQQDWGKALHWMRQAAAHGNENAKAILDSLVK